MSQTQKPKFSEGDLVEYESHFDRKENCVTLKGSKALFRGVYLRPLGDIYSDVRVGDKIVFVRTDRLRERQP